MVGTDRGYVRDRSEKMDHFGVLVGKSLPRDRKDRYLALVQSFDARPKRRLWEFLRSQGLQMNQAITFLTDGGDDVRNLAAEMAPYAEHHLDWFHVTMRLTVLGQFAKGLANHDRDEGERIARDLLRIKRYLWHGNACAALLWAEGLERPGRRTIRGLKETASVAQLWQVSMLLVKKLEATFLPGGVPEASEPPDAQTQERWRRRYFAALPRLRRAGIQTVADEQAGAEVYVLLRAGWDRYVAALAPSMAYGMDDIDPAGIATEPAERH